MFVIVCLLVMMVMVMVVRAGAIRVMGMGMGRTIARMGMVMIVFEGVGVAVVVMVAVTMLLGIMFVSMVMVMVMIVGVGMLVRVFSLAHGLLLFRWKVGLTTLFTKVCVDEGFGNLDIDLDQVGRSAAPPLDAGRGKKAQGLSCCWEALLDMAGNSDVCNSNSDLAW